MVQLIDDAQVRGSVSSRAHGAERRLDDAIQAFADGKQRRAHNALRNVVRRLLSLRRGLNSLSGQRRVPADLRLDLNDRIQDLLKSLDMLLESV